MWYCIQIFINEFRQNLKIYKQVNEYDMLNLQEIETAIIKYVKTFEEYKNNKITLNQFADGWIFATLLKSASGFKIKYGELVQPEHCTKWTHRLNNLKKVVTHIEDYFEQQIKKGIKTKDVDLIEIAKNQNIEEIVKMFELVIAALTEAPNKEDHINAIMSLDQKSQTAFVSIIQNLLQNRILDKNQTKEDKIMQTMNHLQMENALLRSEVQSLLNENHQLDKQIQQLKHRQTDYIEQLNKIRDQQIDKTHILHEQPKQKQHLRNMIQNLKQKLISTVRQSQTKIAGLKEQNHILQSKCLKFEEIEDQLEDYKRKYNQIVDSHGRAKLWEREKSKLIRALQQKDEVIKKINAKLDEVKQENFAMQERQVYTKMELQKRDVRFSELQKQVKRKYPSSASVPIIPDSSQNSSKSLQLSNTNVAILSQQINQIDRLEIEQLKNQIEQLKKKNRQTERQNNKLKRNIDKMSTIESDKKKLQRLILDLNNEKREQVEVLLGTTYQFYSENTKLRQILARNGIQA